MNFSGAAPTLKSCGGLPGNCTNFNDGDCENPDFSYQFKSVNVEVRTFNLISKQFVTHLLYYSKILLFKKL